MSADRRSPGAASGDASKQARNASAQRLQRAGNRAALRTFGPAPDDIQPEFDVAPTEGAHRAIARDLLPGAGRTAPAIGHDAPGHIRRHASWEHKMLGDVDPDTLEVIASGKTVAAEEKKKKSIFSSTRNSAKTIQSEAGLIIDMASVLHTIDQEIARLQLFRTAPPTGAVAAATEALQAADAKRRKGELGADLDKDERAEAEKEIDDAKWDVRLVELTLKDASKMLVTYGELNTLADFYGGPAEISQTPADNFRGILAGVREESLRKFMRLRNELTLEGDKKYDADSDDAAFAGSIGNKNTKVAKRYRAIMNKDAYGEVKLMGETLDGREARQEIDGRKETSYMAGLVRNACHFAPQSWHSWAAAHEKAIALAREAYTHLEAVDELEEQIKGFRDSVPPGASEQLQASINAQIAAVQLKIDAEKKLAAEKQNAALIENGFGDHFLQDSYAAGHLINKTLVMQWFAQWLDAHGRKRDYSTEEQWRQIQQIAYGQEDLAGRELYEKDTIGKEQSNDPQSVENMGGEWTDRFAALGLNIPGVLKTPGTDEFILFTWWQEQAMDGNLLKTDAPELLGAGPIKTEKRLKDALKKLVDAGVVYYNWYSTKDRAKGAESIGIGSKSLRLKKEYIPKKENEAKFKSAVTKASTGDMSEYGKMSAAVTYSDYHNFINHGYLQLATNVLHDHFCKNGLDVATAAGETPFKIYGDNAMLDKESAKGVKHSSITSRMSRDSIFEIATGGATAKSTASIAARFPTYVKDKDGGLMSLAAWHGDGGELRNLCFKTIFDQAAALFSKSTVVAKAQLAKKASKDDTVEIHSGESF